MIVGFCTSATNRRWQLERTLALNLGRLRDSGSFLALCDYGSSDGLPDLVRQFDNDLVDGTLLYFRTEEPQGYHSSRAKNLAHRLALRRRPDVLFNLDADNFLSSQTLPMIAATLGPEPEACLHNWTTHDDGSCGRVALRAATWVALGGYDESFAPASWQDLDLLMRCRALGLRYVLNSEEIPAPVANTLSEKIRDLELPAGASREPEEDGRRRYERMFRQNVIASLARPARLSLDEQRRYEGQLNFAERATI